MKAATIKPHAPLPVTHEQPAAEAHLVQACRVMAHLIQQYGSCQIGQHQSPPFETLTSSIISQQLSAKAARTIKQRVMTITGDFTARSFLDASPLELRSAGLSSAKLRYILALAAYADEGGLTIDILRRQSDEEVVLTLTQLPGIGRWTAEMFLIFCLKRPDVLALGDAGLRRATRLLYGETAKLEDVASAWRPHASTASWYLWRHLDAGM